MKAIDCGKCRKRILEEVRKENQDNEYEFFQNSARSFAVYAVCGVLTAMARRGRTKEYITKLYDDMCLLFATPDMFGKQITMTDVMHSLEREYGIDWSKLQVNIEDEKSWKYHARKGVR